VIVRTSIGRRYNSISFVRWAKEREKEKERERENN